MHLLRYKPGGDTPPDYGIVYQCGHVLRLSAAPPDRRFDIAIASSILTASYACIMMLR
jgi:hypothetical protein